MLNVQLGLSAAATTTKTRKSTETPDLYKKRVLGLTFRCRAVGNEQLLRGYIVFFRREQPWKPVDADNTVWIQQFVYRFIFLSTYM